jgi:hypothetical protein
MAYGADLVELLRLSAPMSIASCAVRVPAIYRFNHRLNSSWSSTSRPPARLASFFRPRAPPPKRRRSASALLYRLYATTRKSSGEMIRKLSVFGRESGPIFWEQFA